MSEKLPSRCPNCGSDNLQTEPLYDEEEGPTGELALFCFSCGRYMGEMPSELQQKMQSYRQSLSDLLPGQPQSETDTVREYLLGRRMASSDFD